MPPKVYLTLEGAGGDPGELGPFDSIAITNQLKVGNSSSPCATFANGVWTITDGGALGDSSLTGTVWTIILGQAKLI